MPFPVFDKRVSQKETPPRHSKIKSQIVKNPAPLSISSNFDPSNTSSDYIEYRGEYLRVNDLEDQSISPEILQDMHMSSTVRTQLPPKMNLEALVQTAEHYLKQCSPTGHPAATYDQALLHTILPEIITRLKDNMAK